MSRISELRESFAGLNKRSMQTRVRKAEIIESWIRDTMNYHGIAYKGYQCREWQKCSGSDDRNRKRDAQQVLPHGETIYSQIKWRQPDSGSDIEAAIIQPYYGLNAFKEVVTKEPEKLEQHVWARDYKFDGEFYAVLSRGWDVLRVISYPAVKTRINHVIKEWWASNHNLTQEYDNNTFYSSIYEGLILKCFRDKGHHSFDSGLGKILCYFPITVFKDDEVKLFDMIDPPGYVLAAA
jgi:hypothetical protein